MSPQEQSPPNHIPSLEAVNAAYVNILAHNREHTGLGAAFKNIIKAVHEHGEIIDYTTGAVITGDPEEAEDKLTESIQAQTEQAVIAGDMHGELQGILHGDTFMRIGLKMAPIGSYVSGGKGQKVTTEELVPIVDNTQLYKEFLSTIEPNQVETGNQLLPNVLKTMKDTAGHCYNRQLLNELPEEQQAVARQHGEDVLRTFVEIAPEYKRLGLDPETLRQKFPVKPAGTGYSVLGANATPEQREEAAAHDAYNWAQESIRSYEILEDFVKYWGQDVLSEYVAIGPMAALEEEKIAYFDGMQDRLVTKVDDIVKLTQTERTHEFGVEAATAMLSGLEKTLQDMDDKPGEWFAGESNRALITHSITQLRRVTSSQGSTSDKE